MINPDQTCTPEVVTSEANTDSRPKAWFYSDLPWCDKPFPGCIASSRFIAVLDWSVLVSCIYVGVSVPYVVGFSKTGLWDDHCLFYNFVGSEDNMHVVFASLDLITDFIFFLDMFALFHTTRWVLVPGSAMCWELCDDLAAVRWYYFAGEFKYDCFGQIPWHYLNCIFPQAFSELKALRLFRLLKLLRMRRIRDRIIKLETRLAGHARDLLMVLQLFVFLFLSAQWLACLWFWVGYPDGWTVAEGITHPERVDDTYFAWVSSFYWAITTMTTIGSNIFYDNVVILLTYNILLLLWAITTVTTIYNILPQQ